MSIPDHLNPFSTNFLNLCTELTVINSCLFSARYGDRILRWLYFRGGIYVVGTGFEYLEPDADVVWMMLSGFAAQFGRHHLLYRIGQGTRPFYGHSAYE